jgi:DNA-binding SARP family transcriptional activator/ATP/maltotriose-dependent transcriptional regulator MalT
MIERHPAEPTHRRELLLKASEWYRSRGDLPEALTCAQRSGDLQAVEHLVAAEGDALIAGGHTRQVIDAIAKLPAESLTPGLSLIDAEARQLLGDWEGASERYRLLVPEKGQIAPGLAWRLGFLKHMQGRVGEALETYARGELGTGELRDEAALVGWRASAHWLRGERDKAKELADAALELAREADDPRALATAHTVLALVAALDGDRAANDVHYLKALEHAERGRDVVQTIRIRSNRASAFLEEGEFDAALAELDIALRLADMTGFELWRGMSLSNRAQVYAFRGRIEEAIADLAEARAAFRHIGSLLESYPVTHQGDVYRLRGDSARARAAYEEAIVMAEGQQDLQVLVPANAGLARLIAAKEPEKAMEAASRAIDTDAGIGRAPALVAAGWAAHHAGEAERSVELAAESAHVARARRDLPGLGEALELRAFVDPAGADDFLEEAHGIWRRLDVPIALARVELARARRVGGLEGSVQAGRAADTLQRHGAIGLAREARAAETAMARREETGKLVIKTLGGFDIVVSGTSAPRSAWQSKVAREIFWMLLSARGRPLTREVIIDRLWPEDDLSKASNKLSVALSTIRKVLDVDGSDPKEHIVSDRDAVRFSRDNAVVDVEEFLEEAKRGRRMLATGHEDRGLALMRAAEERYVGEFLEEEPYADWAISLREEARSEYLSIAGILAQAASDEGDHDAASRRYLRMLERDPFDEPAHLGLVVAMRLSGRHGTARRLYGNYVTRMAELEVEPEPFPDAARGPA